MAKRRRTRRSAPLFDAADTGDQRTDDAAVTVALHEAAQTRYLNYALSVITARALPDVRDGLKPVQRRILYTMWQQHLNSEAKPRKCAKVVGDVMGSYHPHGDSAIYDTLVRMAQPFALRYPLVEGFGNFGSLDGDSAAAMRYTECRLQKASGELLSELDRQTVTFRPTYDGTRQEPVVLPARLQPCSSMVPPGSRLGWPRTSHPITWARSARRCSSSSITPSSAASACASTSRVLIFRLADTFSIAPKN